MVLDLFANHRRLVATTICSHVTGSIAEITGLTVVAQGLPVPVGTLCEIERRDGSRLAGQVVGVSGDRAVLMTLSEPLGVGAGDRVVSSPGMQHVPVGSRMLGSVLDGLGRPIGGRKDFPVEAQYPVYREAPPALSRRTIDSVLPTGIRAIDAMHTVGAGQRLGIFAGTGVGKSVLLGMIARNSAADVIVVALVGERGREVGDFIRKSLGDEGFSRSVLVVSTSDQSPVLRVRAGFVATAVAEFFRDRGADVLLLMDSTTRIAMAQRQIGLAAGEPPTTKGYPPSVFALLPKLLERSGTTSEGTITGLYTVLVEGDDINEPVSDAVRGVLDGHLWLSRDLANRAHYPAISMLESISRVMSDVVDEDHRKAADAVRRVMAVWADIEDLVNVGAYAPGSNVDFDLAVEMKPVVDEYMCQAMDERSDWTTTKAGLIELCERIESVRNRLAGGRPATVRAAAV